MRNLSNNYLYVILLLFAWRSSLDSIDQNLVPNYSFEEFDECPNTYNQGKKLKEWICVQSVPDLFNICAKGTYAGVPDNFYGSAMPTHGQGYIGLTIWHESANADIIGVKLKKPLRKGKRYKVSFKVRLGSKYARYYANNIGALFSLNPEADATAGKAHIVEKKILKKANEWVTVSGVFEADQAYTHLLLGNFFTREATDVADYTENSGGFGAAYYYLDEVIVQQTRKKSN